MSSSQSRIIPRIRQPTLLIVVLLYVICSSIPSKCFAFMPQFTQRRFGVVSSAKVSFSRLSMAADTPFGVVVHTEIDPDRMAEFLKMIETNAIETRKEPQCVRFDVLRSQEAPNQFIFYELYQSPDAIEYHKQQKHYQAWADFKESGGTLSAVTYKMDGEFVKMS